MKKWIRFILRVNARLDKLCFNIERKIDRLSCNLIRPPTELADEIYAWQDFKRRLVNLRVLYNKLREGLLLVEWERLGKDLSDELTEKCTIILAKEGCDEQKFIKEYYKSKRLIESISTVPL